MQDPREQAKDVICDIIGVAGGELHKRVALYKAFYYAHLYYWQDSEGTLTDYPIVRMQNGPGIDDGINLLEELEEAGRIREEEERIGPFTEFSYALTTPFTIDPNAPQHQAILKAIELIRDKSATELSQMTHDYSRSWNKARYDGEELDIYLDLMDEASYEAMSHELKKTTEMVDSIFA